MHANKDPSNSTVESVMTKAVKSISKNATATEACEIMATKSASGLPVVDSGSPYKVITSLDLFPAVMKLYEAKAFGHRSILGMRYNSNYLFLIDRSLRYSKWSNTTLKNSATISSKGTWNYTVKRSEADGTYVQASDSVTQAVEAFKQPSIL
jgi:hypothetical protein